MSKRTRYPLDLTDERHDKLAGWAKAMGLSQSEVVEAMIDLFDFEANTAYLQQARAEKVAAREQAKKIRAKLKQLSPDQLAQLGMVLD